MIEKLNKWFVIQLNPNQNNNKKDNYKIVLLLLVEVLLLNLKQIISILVI